MVKSPLGPGTGFAFSLSPALGFLEPCPKGSTVVPKINLFLPSAQQTQGQTSQGTGAGTPALGKPFEKFIESETAAAPSKVSELALFGLPALQAGLPPAPLPAPTVAGEPRAAPQPGDRPLKILPDAQKSVEPSGIKSNRADSGLIALGTKTPANVPLAKDANGRAELAATAPGQAPRPGSIAPFAPLPADLVRQGQPPSGSQPSPGAAALAAGLNANNSNTAPAGEQAAAFLSPEGNLPPSAFLQPAQPGNPAAPFSPLIAAAVQSHPLAEPPPEEQEAAVQFKAPAPVGGAVEGGVLVAEGQKALPIAAMPAKASPASAILGQVIEQLSLKVKEGQSEIHLKLDPPSLGSVRMNVAAIGDQVRAVIITDHHAVKQVIESQLSELRSSLAGQGMKVDSFTVLVGGQDAGGGSRPEAHAAGFSHSQPGETALPALEMENPAPPQRTLARGGSSISIFA